MPDVSSLSNSASVRPDPTSAPTQSSVPKLSLVALRERKKDQTREALAQAAFSLFQTKGYEATTVAEIARAAKVSRRTFFRYYSTKDALLFVDDSDKLELFRELLSKTGAGVAGVRQACLELAAIYMQERERVLARTQIIASSPILGKQARQQDEQWEQAIAAALTPDAASPVAQRRAAVLASAIFGAMRATLSAWKQLECRADLPRLMGEALDLFASRAPAHAVN